MEQPLHLKMGWEGMYKITVHNDEETVLRFTSKTQLGAIDLYREYVKEHRKEGYLTEDMDFDIKYIGTWDQ